MAEPIYQHEYDGQEVEEEDINLLGTNSGLADDRVLAELLRLQPFDGTSTAKAILPYALRAGDSATVIPNGATGAVRVLPFRAIVGSRTALATDPVANWRDIRSAVFAQKSSSGARGAVVSFAPNTTGVTRWDLVYAAFTPDANGAQVTRYVRDPVTGAITAPSVVTTLVQQVAILVAQGPRPILIPIPIITPVTTLAATAPATAATASPTPTAATSPATAPAASPSSTAAASTSTPALPAVPGDGGGTFYIPLAYVAIPAGFSATSTVLPGSIFSVAPVISLARVSGTFSVQPANQQFVANGSAITAAQLATWAGGTRPGFYMPPDMVGGESRMVAIDFTVPGYSHGGGFAQPNVNNSASLAVVDDTRDWRGRVFRWMAFARGPNTVGNPGFAWQLPVPASWSLVPNAFSSGIAQDLLFGFGQSFQSDASTAGVNGGMAVRITPLSGAGSLAAVNVIFGLMVDLTDGKLKIYLQQNPTNLTATPNFVIFIWLDASAPFTNWQ